MGLTYFTKDVTGFTATSTIPVNFQELDEWGIDTSDLSQTQRDQLSICSPDCIVTVNTTENINGATEVDGWEVVWVQPLDFLLPGLGFNTSATFIEAVNENGDEISGVSDSYSGTAYYENDVMQVRMTYYHQQGAHQFDSWGAPVTGRDRSQLDLSASYLLPYLPDNNLSVTFDAYNLTNETISSYMELDNSQTFNSYSPGATYTLGIRGNF